MQAFLSSKIFMIAVRMMKTGPWPEMDVLLGRIKPSLHSLPFTLGIQDIPL